MEYKERFKGIFQGVVDIVSLVDIDYNILMVNEAYERFLKITSEECIGKKCYRILREKDVPCDDCPIMKSGMGENDIDRIVIPVGEEKVSISRHPVYDKNGRIAGIFEIGRIITKEVRMELELQHQGRLKIMGELAASIVHEIKNPLASIGLMAISVMERLKQQGTKDDLYRDMESVLQEVQRLEKLLENLMDFGKPKLFITSREDIHYPIDQTLKLLNKRFKTAQISVERAYDPEIPAIMIDASKMQQVFLNILLNAIDAMPAGGNLIIKTDIVHEKLEKDNTRDWVQVAIRDTGKGIKKECMQYIFDPFYSGSSGRTGLGLSIVSRIIELHHGLISIESEEGKGTNLTISLPVNWPMKPDRRKRER